MGILSSNSDGDGEGMGTYVKYRGWVRGDRYPPLPIAIPTLYSFTFTLMDVATLYTIYLFNFEFVYVLN